ncbi:MAG TPA: DUF1850 domain-containing protein [Bacillota bacterium]|jgi:hypothetical protein|nr:DUF1850 domain-containing protein [Bacillota bacterium]HQE67411.1 DUF1850 domain-containing protein [Bacillota bacterium]HQJ38209.1 DUF1850 domain-containing protein [Bacillota bacterium]HQL37005.1 DUF1850 domain-containing protein [Bacillota bacterium]HRU41754.1 DUF1850 domain-containing protein [Candidatus Diapherotrites archaeon]
MKKLIYTVFLLLLIIIILNVPVLNRFTISNGKTGEIAYIDKIENVREFAVSFRHSVNRTLVNEFIRIEGEMFVVYKTTFYSYGAGMPEYDANSKQIITITDGIVQIENIDRKLDSFTYMVGTYADHTLSYKDKTIKLSELVEPQKPAYFNIQKVSCIELIKYILR